MQSIEDLSASDDSLIKNNDTPFTPKSQKLDNITLKNKI